MPRSPFEQMIDAGLAAGGAKPRRGHAFNFSPRNASRPEGAWPWRSADPASAPPKVASSDLARGYRDWLKPFQEMKREPQSEVISQPPCVEQDGPSLAKLLDQLANHKSLTRAQLMSLRRQIARRLHPDLASPDERAAATAEMARLNAVIDKALSAHRR